MLTRARVRLRRLAIAALIAPPLLAAGYFTRRAIVPPDPVLPRLADGRVEGCLACHASVQGLGSPHDPAVIGCSSCHLGDARAADAERAHRGMVVLSGDLATVYQTCGNAACHPVEAGRVTTSLMARAPGILEVNRFAFGERPTPDSEPEGFAAIDPNKRAASPAESHARALCGSCHLGAKKRAPGDEGFFSRGGGCTACHLAPPKFVRARTNGRVHPDVSAFVAEKRCEGCHSRSGRIAMSYRGVVELEPGDPRVTSKLPDGRPVGHASPDVHAKAGMTCVDCHTERELMGDGSEHRHAHEALEIRCADCHAPGPRPAPSDDAARVAAVLRRSWDRRGMPPLPAGASLRASSGTELWRTHEATLTMALVTTGERRAIPPSKSGAHHAMRGHERLDCEACHAVWAPRCTKCHTSFDPNGKDVDHLSGAEIAGRWIEEAGGNGDGPPLLAVGPRGTIGPFVEGMTMRIDGVGAAPIDRVLWAPLSPHTTGASRACASCHDPGQVDRVYPREGGLTRTTARLLDAGERAKIARVGACIPCHRGYDDRVYTDFGASVKRLQEHPRDARAAKCRSDLRGK